MGSRGRTLADAAWDTETKAVKHFISLQKPAPAPAINPRDLNIQPQDYLSSKHLKKIKGKVSKLIYPYDIHTNTKYNEKNQLQITQRILENHANVKELSALEAKMQFIKAWQNLPEFGISLFVVKFMGHRKEELIGVAHNRIMKLDINNGDHQKTWRYSTMKVSIRISTINIFILRFY